MLKTGHHQPCLALALPAGWEAGGPSSVSSIHQEVDSTSVSLGKQPKKLFLHQVDATVKRTILALFTAVLEELFSLNWKSEH